MSALNGQTNTYPPTTALTVTATKCGVTTEWNVLTGRSDTSRRCRLADGSWKLVGTTVSDRFFNTTQVETSKCDVVELSPDPTPRTSTHGRCTNGDKFVDLTYDVIGTETVRIGGTDVPTVHLRITSTQGGTRSGAAPRTVGCTPGPTWW